MAAVGEAEDEGRLPASRKPAGAGELQWDGRDESGGQSPAGLYFLRFQLGDEVQVRRIALLGRD